MFIKTLSLFLCLIVGCTVTQAQPPSTPMTLRDFSGTCQGNANHDFWDNTMGWTRHDLGWHVIEPIQGQWDDKKLEKWGEKHILANQKEGVICLPILSYGTKWSTEKNEWSYRYAGKTRTVIPQEDGTYLKRTVAHKADGTDEIVSEKVAKHRNQFPLDESHITDWQNYVRRAVTKFMAAPYNLKYFQIWNEAHPESGFYEGSLDNYMTRVHLPAAKIIQELGAKVVYGGWPCCGGMGEYVALLDKHKAWSSIDVHDIHYFPVSSYAYLYRKATDRGIKHPFIWQTEFGFTTNPTSLINAYPRILDWSLRKGYVDKDQFKVFWFALGAPNDPKAYGYMHSLFTGKKLTGNGAALKTMGDLFDNHAIERYTDIQTKPKLIQTEIDERLSGIESFKAGNRLVMVVHLSQNNTAKIFTDWQGDGDTMHLDHGSPMLNITLPKLSRKQITAAYRVDLTGQKVNVTSSIKTVNAGTKLQVPIRDAKKSQALEWNNKSKSPRVFFVQIDLTH